MIVFFVLSISYTRVTYHVPGEEIAKDALILYRYVCQQALSKVKRGYNQVDIGSQHVYGFNLVF